MCLITLCVNHICGFHVCVAVSASGCGVGQSEPRGDGHHCVLDRAGEADPSEPPMSGHNRSGQHHRGDRLN